LALRILELFGFAPQDLSEEAEETRKALRCPFLQCPCTKLFHDNTPSGVCTVQQIVNSEPVVCCPNRLYDGDYRFLADVAKAAFGEGVKLLRGREVAQVSHDGRYVAVFGKRWGKELRLPQKRGGGGYYIDWILALIGADGNLQEFVAVEVQAIDTTGSYRVERDAYMKGAARAGPSKAGLNWENVAKRILSQIIYKGHVLRLEPICTKGLFFVVPTPVYNRIRQRIAGDLRDYRPHPGSLTFLWYDLGPEVAPGGRRLLIPGNHFTTTIDQLSYALSMPTNLPPAGVYQRAIEAVLNAK
jgi:hypothetical protein